MSLFCEMLLANTSSPLGQTNKGWSHIAGVFGAIMKKVLGLFVAKVFRSKNIPGLKTRNNKAATKQKGQIGEIYFLTSFLFWVKTNSSEFIFLKINQVWLISLIGCPGLGRVVNI